MKFEVTILGCGSATPTLMHSPTAQVVVHEAESLLIDCGEGTQLKLRGASQSFQRIGHIFISHLHGDHYLGVQGLLSTMHLLGRTKAIHLYAHEDLQVITEHQLRLSKSYFRFPLIWHKLDYSGINLIADLKHLEVYSFPLKHGIATCGFLLREKPKLRNIIPERITEYNIPIARIRQVKAGADLVLESGEVIPNAQLTRDPLPPRSYAYCSDTAFTEQTAEYVHGVDLLYHESTFLQAQHARAVQTKHSTAIEAATVAKLAGVGQLLLGHFSARYKQIDDFQREAAQVFARSVLSVEGITYPIGPVHK